MIKGPKAFNSGRPLANDCFFYTFDEEGRYTVVSQGSPGYACTINVVEVGMSCDLYLVCLVIIRLFLET